MCNDNESFYESLNEIIDELLDIFENLYNSNCKKIFTKIDSFNETSEKYHEFIHNDRIKEFIENKQDLIIDFSIY